MGILTAGFLHKGVFLNGGEARILSYSSFPSKKHSHYQLLVKETFNSKQVNIAHISTVSHLGSDV